MGKIEFANCQDLRNQKQILELDCPHCHARGHRSFCKRWHHCRRQCM